MTSRKILRFSLTYEKLWKSEIFIFSIFLFYADWDKENSILLFISANKNFQYHFFFNDSNPRNLSLYGRAFATYAHSMRHSLRSHYARGVSFKNMFRRGYVPFETYVQILHAFQFFIRNVCLCPTFLVGPTSPEPFPNYSVALRLKPFYGRKCSTSHVFLPWSGYFSTWRPEKS